MIRDLYPQVLLTSIVAPHSIHSPLHFLVKGFKTFVHLGFDKIASFTCDDISAGRMYTGFKKKILKLYWSSEHWIDLAILLERGLNYF